METLLSNVKIAISEKIYVKDPETSTLGKKIIRESIFLIDEIGFENFTFKKLGEKIGSNESSIYRYFDNKHKLLIYLSSWYWGWIEYKLLLATTNIENPNDKLIRAITVITEKIEDDLLTEHIDEAILNKIIIAEFSKILQTKEVDDDNSEGFFAIYKRINYRIASIVNEVNPDYLYAKSLVSTIIEGSLHQYFLKDHLKTITNCNETVSPTHFYLNLISIALKN
jgi:AcrR family transcriptional regulator